MYINFERLRDAGWAVNVMSEGVEILGQKPIPAIMALPGKLKDCGLSGREADLLVDEFAGKVEFALIAKELV